MTGERRFPRLRGASTTAVFVLATVLLGAGAVGWLADARGVADACWVAATAVGLIHSSAATVNAVRRRSPSVDVIAVLALVGALVVGEPFAGAVIAVMLASGQLLEARAQARARRDLSRLLARAPRIARRRRGDQVEVVAVDDVAVGDRLVVGPGEIVPVDGRLAGAAVTDESALTGEPLPVERAAGEPVRSGVVNAGGAFDLVASATAAASTYAGVLRLVEGAQAESAPFVRRADRLAAYFVPLTVALAGAAWALSGDSVRAVAVLVVATPCPLLLAVPIAIMSGVSRAARIGVIVKGGAALEQLAASRVMLLDKTGTLTLGRPEVSDVVAGGHFGPDDVLRYAAAVEQLSPHVLASGVLAAARRRNVAVPAATAVAERPGYGVTGEVEGRRVAVGKAAWIVGESEPRWVRQVRRRAELDGSLAVFVGVDGHAAGALLLNDPLRPDAPRMIRHLRAQGIERVVLLTGDRSDTAATVGRIVGADEVLADCDPAAKLAAVRRESERGPTVMVGDGTNDAPALAAAGVGVAVAARGATASSEAADVVLTADRVDALAAAMRIARRADRLAWWAIGVGMGASVLAMAVAAAGGLVPAVGAVLQEAIDVLAIAIALLAMLPGRQPTVELSAADLETARRMRTEHDATLPVVEQIRAVADALTTRRCDLGPARVLARRLATEVLAHERADEEILVPLMSRALGDEATAAISRTHADVEDRIVRLQRLLDGLDEAGPEDVTELRRMLYGLHAVLQLHNSQEEESAFTLDPAD